jgi:hypothetical protein
MRVYKIEYREYEYQCGISADDVPSTWAERALNDWVLTTPKVKRVMASNSLDAVDLLRAEFLGRRIETASIEHVCKVDIGLRPVRVPIWLVWRERYEAVRALVLDARSAIPRLRLRNL